MSDILDYLQADLDALRDLIYELEIADEHSSEEAQAFVALVTLAKAQFAAQTTLLETLVDKSPALRLEVSNSLERNACIKDVEDMIECCTNKATWRSSLNIYCGLLERRIWKELDRLFPAIFDATTAKERRTLADDYRRLRGYARISPGTKNWQRIWSAIINQAG